MTQLGVFVKKEEGRWRQTAAQRPRGETPPDQKHPIGVTSTAEHKPRDVLGK